MDKAKALRDIQRVFITLGEHLQETFHPLTPAELEELKTLSQKDAQTRSAHG